MSDQASFQRPQLPLKGIVCVFKIDMGRTEKSVELIVMFCTERHREPCHVILAADMVSLYVGAVADHTASARLALSAHAPPASDA